MLFFGLLWVFLVFFHFQLWSLLPQYARGRDQIHLHAQVIPGLRTWWGVLENSSADGLG